MIRACACVSAQVREYGPPAWNMTGDAYVSIANPKPWISEMYGRCPCVQSAIRGRRVVVACVLEQTPQTTSRRRAELQRRRGCRLCVRLCERRP